MEVYGVRGAELVALEMEGCVALGTLEVVVLGDEFLLWHLGKFLSDDYLKELAVVVVVAMAVSDGSKQREGLEVSRGGSTRNGLMVSVCEILCV